MSTTGRSDEALSLPAALAAALPEAAAPPRGTMRTPLLSIWTS